MGDDMNRLSELILMWDEHRSNGTVVDLKALCGNDKALEAKLTE